MRIVFRGKRLDTGYWVYGDLIQSLSGQAFIKYGELRGHSIAEIDPQTIGQYSELNDKQGYALYLGDIVSFGGKQKWEITFENGCFSVFNEPIGWQFDCYEQSGKPEKTDMQYCKLEGNIHDNPEIIKQI